MGIDHLNIPYYVQNESTIKKIIVTAFLHGANELMMRRDILITYVFVVGITMISNKEMNIPRNMGQDKTGTMI